MCLLLWGHFQRRQEAQHLFSVFGELLLIMDIYTHLYQNANNGNDSSQYKLSKYKVLSVVLNIAMLKQYFIYSSWHPSMISVNINPICR